MVGLKVRGLQASVTVGAPPWSCGRRVRRSSHRGQDGGSSTLTTSIGARVSPTSRERPRTLGHEAHLPMVHGYGDFGCWPLFAPLAGRVPAKDRPPFPLTSDAGTPASALECRAIPYVDRCQYPVSPPQRAPVVREDANPRASLRPSALSWWFCGLT